MKLQFDANQEYQLQVIKATVDIFKGQPGNTYPVPVIHGFILRLIAFHLQIGF